MPSAVLDQRDFEYDLARVGALREDGGAMVSETLDGGAKWIEERIPEDAGQRRVGEENRLGVKDMGLFRRLDERVLHELAACMEERSVSSGQKVGDAELEDTVAVAAGLGAQRAGKVALSCAGGSGDSDVVSEEARAV
jgi:hypothetical protein